MRVYAESNFVLELALLQEQSEYCHQLLKLAESKQIQLVVPAFSLAEPQATLYRRKQKRSELQQDVDYELTQLARTASYSERIAEFTAITSLLTESNAAESANLQNVVSEMVHCAEVIPLNSEIISAAFQFEKNRKLSPPDAIVYASILAHLNSAASGESCFLTRDAKAFAEPDIRDELSNLNCPLISRFDHGLEFVRSRLQKLSEG